VLLQSDLIFTTTRRFAAHYAEMLPLAVVDVPIPFPRIKCYQMWHPQPDRPSDVAWLRSLMAQVSEMLVAKKPRRARPTAAKEQPADKKTDAASVPAAPAGGIGQ
jgi:hypothetical protein